MSAFVETGENIYQTTASAKIKDFAADLLRAVSIYDGALKGEKCKV